MRKLEQHIGALVLLLVFTTGAVGLNVSNIFCLCCQKSSTQVHLMALDEKGCCPHTCDCCRTCDTHKNKCKDSPKKHVFYKLTDDWTVASEEVDFSPGEYAIPEQLYFVEENHLSGVNFIKLPSPYIDTSPPPEWLCTFRC